MINYLFSGIDKVNGFTKEQATSLKKDIKDNSIITFIASDFDNTEKTDTNKKQLIDAFNNIGINFKCEYLVDKILLLFRYLVRLQAFALNAKWMCTDVAV